jgi:uncharacterized protein YdeI (YjbR/CyaY-like superfamily)
MPDRDSRIDAYIARQADFARPILDYVRDVVHEACPGVEETMKWNAPSFVHGGAILCAMAAFRQHASFGYWKHALVVGDDRPRVGMGSYGRLTSVADLPPKQQLLAHIDKAMRLNEAGVAARASARTGKSKLPVAMPQDLSVALHGNAKAKATFDGFAPSQQREYVEWITEAKRNETRQKRLLQAIEWMAEGKRRNWKYERC